MIQPDYDKNLNAYKVPNIPHGIGHKRKKSTAKTGSNMAGIGRKVISGGQIVHQYGKKAAVGQREQIASALYTEIPLKNKTPKSVTRVSTNAAVKKQMSHFQASMLAAATALSPPRAAYVPTGGMKNDTSNQ